MEKISQLMDGELDEREARLEIRRLGADESLAQAWDTYHLIRDVLRDDLRIGSDFESRLRQQLEAEPTVVAPHARFASRVVRHTLPLAATVAAVAVVGWLALNHGALDVFVHPNTGDQLRDHRDCAIWIGRSYELDLRAVGG